MIRKYMLPNTYLLYDIYMEKDMVMERPIGYWLKHLDRLIEATAERVFADQQLTRRHWQIMNVLHQSPRTAADLAEALRPFWTPGAAPLEDVTGELTRRGWLAQDDAGRYTLTAAGQAGHAAVHEKVNGIRSTFLTGLTEEEYRRTVDVLQRMAGNLERAAAE
ncbi:MarR family winged helix-turn-helix transcriptional regulator [Nonomuraea sp. NPDC003727]